MASRALDDDSAALTVDDGPQFRGHPQVNHGIFATLTSVGAGSVHLLLDQLEEQGVPRCGLNAFDVPHFHEIYRHDERLAEKLLDVHREAACEYVRRHGRGPTASDSDRA